MVTVSLILLILLLPSVLLMAIMSEKEMRIRLFFFALGFIAAYESGQINALVFSSGAMFESDVTINIAPAVEEFLKGLPLVLYLFVCRPGKRIVCEYAVWTGIGFALFENAWAFYRSVGESPDLSDIMFALSRGFGASMIHSLCTLILISGICLCMKHRKLVITGSIAMFSFVCVIHSMFNVLIDSKYTAAPFILTIGVYVLMFFIYRAKKKADTTQA